MSGQPFQPNDDPPSHHQPLQPKTNNDDHSIFMSKRSKNTKTVNTDVVEIPDPTAAVSSMSAVRVPGFGPMFGARPSPANVRPSPVSSGRNRWAARLDNGGVSASKKKAMLSDSVPQDFKQFADDLQLRSETGLVLMFTNCVVTHYWTQFPSSLTLVVLVSEEQFGEEVRTQFGDIVYETLFQSDVPLPINFPFATSADIPDGCVGLKFKISADKLEAFRQEDDMGQAFRPNANCDLIIIPTCYPPFGDQPKPGVSFKVARATVHD